MRVRGPDGQTTLQMDDGATLDALVAKIREEMAVKDFSLKSGFPPTPIDLSASSALIKDLGLAGATVTLVPSETETASQGISNEPQLSPGVKSQGNAGLPTFRPKKVEVDETVIELDDQSGYICLRVMPDDNSCMFTAFGGAMQIPDPATYLRNAVAEHILSHPDKYSKAILENKEPREYARMIRDPQRWGGAIELTALSEIYGVGILSLDVKTGQAYAFGEEYPTRCLLVYSGIHYDRIAQTFDLGLPVESDVTIWARDDHSTLDAAKELCAKLKEAKYFTDTQSMAVKCHAPGCEHWLGAGEADIVKHMKETGHSDFSELNID